MNLLEQYIVEVHSVEPFTEEWVSEFPDRDFIKVDVTTNCYGRIKRVTRVFDRTEWTQYQKQGYWMA